MRSLERKIGAICRAVAVKVAEGHTVTETGALGPECPTEQGGRSLTSVCLWADVSCWGEQRPFIHNNTYTCVRTYINSI